MELIDIFSPQTYKNLGVIVYSANVMQKQNKAKQNHSFLKEVFSLVNII